MDQHSSVRKSHSGGAESSTSASSRQWKSHSGSAESRTGASSRRSNSSVGKSQSGMVGNGDIPPRLQRSSQSTKHTLKTIGEDETWNFEDAGDSDFTVKSTARRKAIKMMISKAQGLDLCFMMDATGSMERYIDMVKEKVADMTAAIKDTYPACGLRVSCVIYRDYSDTDSKDTICDFTSDFQRDGSTFQKYLSSLTVKGGDDCAEDVFTGLERAARLDWRAKNRLLVHIGDAPCHGTKFHNLEGDLDDYPDGDKLGRKISDLLNTLYGDCKISQYFFCHLNKSTKKMLQKFKKAISADDWIKTTSCENIDDIPHEVISIARSTISKTMQTSAFRMSGPGEYRGIELETKVVVPSEPNWDKIASLRGRRFKHKSYSSVDEVLAELKHRRPLAVEKINTIEVKIASSPFSSDGAARWPYYARILDPDGNRKMVVKRFKIAGGHSVETYHAEERYMHQMEVQTVADHLAREFNVRTQSLKVSNLCKVDFILVSTLNAGFKFFNMEKHLKGTWIRYTNNAGYVNTREYAPTLQAFTHWTHERSGGFLMVTDLQGVKHTESTSGAEYKFFLSDPAIHCRDVLRFTGTNLGEQGFDLFFLSHKCNNICKKLGLKSSTATSVGSRS